MLRINNEATADDYSAALTLESDFGGRLVATIANASVLARFRPIPPDAGPGQAAAPYDQEQLVTPSTFQIDRLSGVQFRSAVAGTPARVVCSLSEPGDILPNAGTPFLQTLQASGGVGGRTLQTVAIPDIAGGALTSLFTYDIPILGSNQALRVTLPAGEFLNNTGGGSSPRLQIKLGATTVYDDTILSIGSNANPRAFRLEFEILPFPDTAGQLIGGKASIGAADPATVGFAGLVFTSAFEGPFGAISAVDLSSSKTLDVLVNPGAGGATLKFRSGLIELLG